MLFAVLNKIRGGGNGISCGTASFNQIFNISFDKLNSVKTPYTN